MYKVEKHKIKKTNKHYKELVGLGKLTNNLYNASNFVMKQFYLMEQYRYKVETEKDKEKLGNYKEKYEYHKNILKEMNREKLNEILSDGKKSISKFDLIKIMKESYDWQEMPYAFSQAITDLVFTNWKSFYASLKRYYKDKSGYTGAPKAPNYRESGGVFNLYVRDTGLRQKKDGLIHFHKLLNGLTIKPSLSKDHKFKQARFIYKGDHFVVEIVYDDEVEVPKLENNNRVVAIDPGLNNLVTIANNFNEQPILIKGSKLKSINNYFNKEIGKLRSDLDNAQNKKGKVQKYQGTSKRINKLWEKRRNIMQTEMHKISKKIVDYCVENNVCKVIIGKNKLQKQHSKLKNFVQIPLDSLIQKLQYKLENVGIEVVITEESYTSGTSFIDNEQPIKKNYDKKRRHKRGMFVSNEGKMINADVNGALQILKKVDKDFSYSEDMTKIFNPVKLEIV